jgi:hypothetical protein
MWGKDTGLVFQIAKDLRQVGALLTAGEMGAYHAHLAGCGFDNGIFRRGQRRGLFGAAD